MKLRKVEKFWNTYCGSTAKDDGSIFKIFQGLIDLSIIHIVRAQNVDI